MVMPEGLHLAGLVNYTLTMLVLMPFGGGWPLLATQFALPTAGRTRLAAVVNTWIGGTLLAVAVTFWVASVMSYDPSGLRVDWLPGAWSAQSRRFCGRRSPSAARCSAAPRCSWAFTRPAGSWSRHDHPAVHRTPPFFDVADALTYRLIDAESSLGRVDDPRRLYVKHTQ
jgi:hypothetical protein